MQNRISPLMRLKFAKDIEPELFEDKSPRFHLDILKFIDEPSKYKAVGVFRGGGKSTLLNKASTLTQIYFNKEPFILIVSSSEAKALSFLDALKSSIDKASKKGYDIGRGDVWNKNIIEVIVDSRAKDTNGKALAAKCHVCAVSAMQDPRGLVKDNRRPTLIIADDLESNVGAYAIGSSANRHKLRRWFYADLLPALHPKIGKVLIVGTILHEDSLLNNILNAKDNQDGFSWSCIKIPILQNGRSVWQSRFSLEKIEQIKATLLSKGLMHEFYQEYMCAALDPSKTIFKREYFRYFREVKFNFNIPKIKFEVKDGVSKSELSIAPAQAIILKDGEEIGLNECSIYSMMDVASATGADVTAIVTVAIDKQNRFYVLDISSGHWTPYQKAKEIIQVFLRFNPDYIGVEKGGMQNDLMYTIDTILKISGIRVPIVGLRHGGRAKNSRISNLEPYYRVGQIYHNASISNTTELESQLTSFDPSMDSKSDDIMDAMAFLLDFIAGRFYEESAVNDSLPDEIVYDEWA